MQVYLLILAVFTTAVSWASVIVHARTPWRESVMGTHLMAYMFGLALTFTALTIGVLANYDLPAWVEYSRAVLYLSAPIAVTWRLILQVQAQRTAATGRGGRHRHDTPSRG